MVSALLMKGVLCSIYAFQREVVYQALVSVYFFYQSQLESLAMEASYVQAGNATKTWR